ncbi:hypothetical protein YTPLAS18_12000 [Nitrospira sp.]|nr:hypothetical protein YTPLAS18_12000 [Nitrospira sp.]
MNTQRPMAMWMAVVGGLIIGGAAVVGCSSPEAKPMAQPSTQDVRGHADRAFDQLKQEEKERGVPSTPHQ